jgi:hypothetical protein
MHAHASAKASAAHAANAVPTTPVVMRSIKKNHHIFLPFFVRI